MNRSWKFVLPIFVSACTSQVPDPGTVEPESESSAEVRSNTCRSVPRSGALVEAQLLLVAKEGLPNSAGVLTGGEVVAMDPYTGAVFARYQTGPNPFGAVFAPDGLRAYVTDKQDGTLSELDLVNGGILNVVSVGVTPQQPVLAPDGKIYIALSGDQGIGVVDTSRGALEVLPKIETGAGTKPHIVALSPDGATLWATVQGVDPRVLSVELSSGMIRNYRYDLVPRVIHASHDGAWFTAHHSIGLHFANPADGKASTPFVDQNGNYSEARKQIEGINTDENGDLLSITHEGRRALIVLARDYDGSIEKVRDISGLPANPYWTTIDPSGQVAYVSIPESTGSNGQARGGLVQAWKLTNCSTQPLWSTYVGGSAKRMAID